MPGQPHRDNCDSERCSACGSQRLTCVCPDLDSQMTAWTGEWPDWLKVPTLALPKAAVKFDLGDLYVTTAAIQGCLKSGDDWRTLVRRHSSGDFGRIGRLDEIEVTTEEVRGGCTVTDDAAKLNEISIIRKRGRVHSVYRTQAGDQIWVITDLAPGIGETTLMLAEEY
jgi:hypothetical protein